MNIQVAVLCDAATEDNGKLNLLGAFDTIYAPQLPAVHPQCAVALRVTFTAGDEGQHKLTLNFINADGHAIMPPIEIPVAVALPDDAHFCHAQFHREHPAIEIRRGGPVFRGPPARRPIAGEHPVAGQTHPAPGGVRNAEGGMKNAESFTQTVALTRQAFCILPLHGCL